MTTTLQLDKDDDMHLIVDADLEKQVLSKTTKRPLVFDLFIERNKPIKATITINNNSFDVYGEVCEEAKNHPLTEDEIDSNFKKVNYLIQN